MAGQMNGVMGRAQRTIGQFSLAQRTLAVIGIAGVLLGAFALYSWLSKPTMAPLYSSLSATDAAAIVEQLDAKGVSYELSDGGSTVLVPNADVYQMRLAMAAAGLPSASSEGEGYSLLDNMGVTSSDFQQQVTYQRALEGELARTIEALEAVQTASVHLAMPEESVFVAEQADPTASVFVETSAGASLNSDQVQSIVHLVSASVEGMEPSDVAVIDAAGNVLSTVGAMTAGGVSSGETADYEARVSSNVQAMLDTVLGPGNAVVSVTAELDFDQTERVSETYTAPDPVVPPTSSSTTVEQYSGTGGEAVGGVLGVDGTTVSGTTVGGTSDGSYSKESATVNNPVNKVVEQSTTAPGSLQRQSVSVIVSDQLAGVDLTALEASIAAAAGIDLARGDLVSVTQMPFDTTAAAQAEEALAEADKAATAERTTDLIKTGAMSLVGLIAVILLFVFALRLRGKKGDDAIDVGDLELLEAAKTALANHAEGLTPPALTARAPSNRTRRDEVLAMAADQPAEVAEVLRAWLTAGRAS